MTRCTATADTIRFLQVITRYLDDTLDEVECRDVRVDEKAEALAEESKNMGEGAVEESGAGEEEQTAEATQVEGEGELLCVEAKAEVGIGGLGTSRRRHRAAFVQGCACCLPGVET